MTIGCISECRECAWKSLTTPRTLKARRLPPAFTLCSLAADSLISTSGGPSLYGPKGEPSITSIPSSSVIPSPIIRPSNLIRAPDTSARLIGKNCPNGGMNEPPATLTTPGIFFISSHKVRKLFFSSSEFRSATRTFSGFIPV